MGRAHETEIGVNKSWHPVPDWGSSPARLGMEWIEMAGSFCHLRSAELQTERLKQAWMKKFMKDSWKPLQFANKSVKQKVTQAIRQSICSWLLHPPAPPQETHRPPQRRQRRCSRGWGHQRPHRCRRFGGSGASSCCCSLTPGLAAYSNPHKDGKTCFQDRIDHISIYLSISIYLI